MGNRRKTDTEAARLESEFCAAFRTRIRQARRDTGLSQADLARRIKATESAVSRWMTGKSLPEAVYLPALARELRVSVDWLLGCEDTKKQKQIADAMNRLTNIELAMDVIRLTIKDLERKNDED